MLVLLIGMGPAGNAMAALDLCSNAPAAETSASGHARHASHPADHRPQEQAASGHPCNDCAQGCCSGGFCQHGACGGTAAALSGHLPLFGLEGRDVVASAVAPMALTERIASPFRPPRT